ncbi:hypothetical protein GDO81_023142 [Engystomops pustulosus]|uniref:Uncharacterized protein n=1 Tax=Engystomops pustulosus TaxID=76066 RepID=A0AAV6Z515_ENGPU|nr:hypothetical protein GDO81_023142 [Engystomops pustulosus]
MYLLQTQGQGLKVKDSRSRTQGAYSRSLNTRKFGHMFYDYGADDMNGRSPQGALISHISLHGLCMNLLLPPPPHGCNIDPAAPLHRFCLCVHSP